MKTLILVLTLTLTTITLYAQPNRWSDPVNISNTGGAAASDMAVGPDGCIHVVWKDNSRLEIPSFDIFCVYSDGHHWFEPVQISVIDTTYSSSPCIAVDSYYTPHVVWNHRAIFPDADIYYSTLTESGWTEPFNLTEDVGTSYDPIIAVDSNDNLHVVMSTYNNGRYSIFYRKFNGIEWLPIEPVIVSDYSSADPDLVIDSEDNLHLVWVDGPYPDADIYYSRFDGISWSPMQDISQVEIYPSSKPAIALDSFSHPHVIWNQITQWGPDPVIEEIYYNYSNGGNWAEPENITNLGLRNADLPEIAISNQDVVCALFFLSSQYGDAYVNFSFRRESTWSLPDTLIPVYPSLTSSICLDTEDVIHAVISAIEEPGCGNLMYMYNQAVSIVNSPQLKNIACFNVCTNPNPSNSSTIINLTFPNHSETNLSIYNLNGQLIKEITNGIFPAGEHQICWNGSNRYGKEVSAGVYLLRLQVNGEVITKRLTIIK